MTAKQRIDLLRERTERRKQLTAQLKSQSQPKQSSPKPKGKLSHSRYTLPCIHEGAVLEWCNTCNGEMKHVRDCDINEKCTRGKVSHLVQACVECKDYEPEPNSSRQKRTGMTLLMFNEKSKKTTVSVSKTIISISKENSMAKQNVNRQKIAQILAERRQQRVDERKAQGNTRPQGQQAHASAQRNARLGGFGAGKREKATGLVWEYGITTVDERKITTLPITLESLKRAGFDKPRLFVDGSNALAFYAATFGLPVTVRGNTNVRTFANWYLAAVELYMRNPLADRYFLLQDDIVAVKNLRQYLEYVPYPDGKDGKPRGYLNLITYPQNENLKSQHESTLPEKHEGQSAGWYPSNQLGKGAQGLIFNNEAMVSLLTSNYMVERVKDQQRGWQGLDGGIAVAMKRMGCIEYVHTPSLIRHIGTETSMGPNHPKTQPIDKSFPGEQWDAMSLVLSKHLSSQDVKGEPSENHPSIELPEGKDIPSTDAGSLTEDISQVSSIGTDSEGDDGR